MSRFCHHCNTWRKAYRTIYYFSSRMVFDFIVCEECRNPVNDWLPEELLTSYQTPREVTCE